MTLNLMIGFVLGAMIACAFVVIRFMLDDKYKTVDDIHKYTGLTTLAVILKEPAAEKQKGGKQI